MKMLSRLVAALALLSVAPFALAQGKLTILWAQWDPANYLQELVKDYEKATRREGGGRNHAVARLPEQGLQGIHRQGFGLRHGGR